MVEYIETPKKKGREELCVWLLRRWGISNEKYFRRNY